VQSLCWLCVGFILGDLLLVGVAVVLIVINFFYSFNNILINTLIVIANVIISPIFPLPDIEQARTR